MWRILLESNVLIKQYLCCMKHTSKLMLKHGSDKCQSDSTTQAIYISFNFSSYGKVKAL